MRLAWLSLLVLAACRTAPPAVGADPPATRAPETEPAPAPSPWSLDLSNTTLRIERASVGADARVLFAGEYTGTLDVAPHASVTSRGERDVAVLTVDASGSLVGVESFGSEGDDDLQGLRGNVLSLRTFDTIEIGSTTLALPAPDDPYIPPSIGVAIELSTPPVVRHAVENPHRTEAWPLEGGDLVVATTFDNGEAPLRSTVQRVDANEVTWTATLAEVAVSAVVQGPTGLWVATRGRRTLSTHAVDPASGVFASPSVRVQPGFDDLGSIVVLDPSGTAWGHTSSPIVGESSHSARPFMATADAFTPLLDATGFVLAVDPTRGDVLVTVLHDAAVNGEGAEVSSPGVHVVGPEGHRRLIDGAPTVGLFTPTHVVVVHGTESGSRVEALPR